jgi:cyclase
MRGVRSSLAGIVPAAGKASLMSDAQLTEVADGVFAHRQLPGGWCLNNSGVLADPAGTVVIDTAATARRAEDFRRTVDGLPGGPVRAVVNTHFHGDHTHGNYVFDEATVIAHHGARDAMAETGLALTGLWPDVPWGDLRVVLPRLTFETSLTLHLSGGRRVELIHPGPAHTTHDTVVWLPDDGVLFTGDVVMSGTSPFVLMGSVSGSLRAVESLRGLGAHTLVCGHGPVCGPEVLEETTGYLRWVQRLADQGRAAGLSPLGAAREAGAGDFAHLAEPERLVGNLHRAYAESAGAEEGRPLDVAAAFADMIALNGGALPPCYA